MSILLNIIAGVFVLLLGMSLVYFSSNLSKILGNSDWANRYFGGTRQAIILFGFVVMIFGFMIMFGLLDFESSNVYVNVE
ncbi:hypothetical protein [Candidatus Vampirococcus lugosii]|uniref:DUF2909 domain-containing protein n=1 Tax=Candidatus Vampirococcus lugosii TaxID=2789015 RepID=A0ABS5QK27_9BACT|nr:hypothetical protein [Candidatus Vampirococcus lugosii]MBS8121452.1 hypothetical protein [Candidatus Vampirococcus lugosii]